MKCVVVGMGEFGSSVAVAFARGGVEVIAVDRLLERVARVKDEVSLAVALDAGDFHALETHDIANADILVAGIRGNFEAQILVVVHAKKLGIPKVVARATTEDHIRILRAVGADVVLNPEREAARTLVNRLLVPNISGYFELADGFSVMEVAAPPKAIGKRLVDLDLRRKFRLNMVALKTLGPSSKQGEEVVVFDPVPEPERELREGDVLSLVGRELDVADFLARFGS